MNSETVSALGIVRYRALGHTITDDGRHDCLACVLCDPDLTPAVLGPLSQTPTDVSFMAGNTADGLARWRRWMERSYRGDDPDERKRTAGKAVRTGTHPRRRRVSHP